MEVSLKVICLPYDVGKQSSIPFINLWRKWKLRYDEHGFFCLRKAIKSFIFSLVCIYHWNWRLEEPFLSNSILDIPSRTFVDISMEVRWWWTLSLKAFFIWGNVMPYKVFNWCSLSACMCIMQHLNRLRSDEKQASRKKNYHVQLSKPQLCKINNDSQKIVNNNWTSSTHLYTMDKQPRIRISWMHENSA